MKFLKFQLKSLLFILPLVLAIIFLILFIQTNSELSQVEIKYLKTVENYYKEKTELIARNNNLQRLLQIRKNDTPNNISLYSWNIERLREKGLSNPVQDIVSDLTKHSELIPYEGKLGGTMRFYDREIWVLNNKWVFAY
ncbi:MAG: hypothetical protein Q7S39_03085, partial [Ignavibacteria bacterium]|nr:hypothetical protein [Ignavibacteria bacterium]